MIVDSSGRLPLTGRDFSGFQDVFEAMQFQIDVAVGVVAE
jgi:hypothetical protein